MVVLVTGANGQLGQALQKASQAVSEIRFVFTDSKMLDITNPENCQNVFEEVQPVFCINCAAYTAVDKAESEADLVSKSMYMGGKIWVKPEKKKTQTRFTLRINLLFM